MSVICDRSFWVSLQQGSSCLVSLTSRRRRSSVQKQQEVLLFHQTTDRHTLLLCSRCSPDRLWVGLLYKDFISGGSCGALAGGNSCSALAQGCSAQCSFCTRPAAAVLNWVSWAEHGLPAEVSAAVLRYGLRSEVPCGRPLDLATLWASETRKHKGKNRLDFITRILFPGNC